MTETVAIVELATAAKSSREGSNSGASKGFDAPIDGVGVQGCSRASHFDEVPLVP
jgi:hypothetical protein